MKYLMVLLVSLILDGLLLCVAYLYGITEEKTNLSVCRFLKKYRTKAKHTVPMLDSKKTAGVALLGGLILVLCTCCINAGDIHILDRCKLLLLMFVLMSSALVDWRYHIIPNKFMLSALAGRVVLYVCEAVWRADRMKQIAISSLIGFAFGFGLMFVTAVISRHAIGYGDVKLLGIIGLYLGLITTYNVLLYALVVSAAVGIFFLVVQKKGRKYRVPFGPFVLVGYVVVLLIGQY